MATPEPSRPYATGAELYRRAGWEGVIPVEGKYPPPKGWTGADGQWPSSPDIYEWTQQRPGNNIAIRLPPTVLGIDVDNYADKRGKATFEECIEAWGPLPETWWSTSRSDGVSGIRLFRIPEGLAWPGQLPGGGVELIQWLHRYALVWPSVHPEGRTYRWTKDGVTSVVIPMPDELPDLPARWVQGLTEGKTYVQEAKADLAPGVGTSWLTGLSGADQPPCPRLAWLGKNLVGALASPSSRHETVKTGTLDLIRRAEEGHPGILQILQSVGESFVLSATADGSRSTRTAWGEWTRLVTGAVSILAGQPRTPSLGDPCIVPSDPPWRPGDPLPSYHPSPRVSGTPWQDAGHLERDGAAAEVADKLLQERITWLRADRAARAYLLAESAPAPAEQPDDYDLEEFVNVADEPAIYRVDGVLPVGGRVVLAAQMKTGKTTFIGNLIRSLVDGTPFLGTFPVQPPVGKVVLLDNEMDARTLRRWLRDMAIVNGRAARVIPMIGRVGGFDIRIPEVFDYWAKRLAAMNCSMLILDCLKPILDVLALDERNDTGKITTPLTNLKIAAGIEELILVHHMGHNSERSRGDSALRGWPEVEWQLVRMAETPDQEAPMDAPRFFKAYGRDVNIPETALVYSPGTRSLSMGTGTREQAKTEELSTRILRWVHEEPGITAGQIQARIGGRKSQHTEPLRKMAGNHWVREVKDKTSLHYYPDHLSPLSPGMPRLIGGYVSPPVYQGDTAQGELNLENPGDE